MELFNVKNAKTDLAMPNEYRNLEVIVAEELVKRILPNHFGCFEIKIRDYKERELFSIKKKDDVILLEGSSPIAIASALNWYLKYECNSHIGWNGDQINLTERLPKLYAEITMESQFRYRYYLNYCTFSYSMVWWDWHRWEREIDFMALNGINLVLALVGQEAVWQKFLTDLGCSQEDIFDFLPGPGYLAWGWLNNLDGWGGPTTQNWIDDQRELQLKILDRLRAFKINPVMQTFTGRVPKAILKLFPEAKITKLPGWYGYDGVYFLDTEDELFTKFSKLFLEAQTSLYGNDHLFAGDIFHEIDSPDNTNQYMSRIYKGIQEGLLEADSKAKWFLQSWTIRDDSISILDNDKTVILDMFCEHEPKWKKTEQFHGLQWLWCIINNFGGRTGLGGSLRKITSDLQNAKAEATEKKLIGIGYVPEGIESNVPVSELLFEMNWRSSLDCVEDWIINYAIRRYGKTSVNIKNAWLKLLDTVYSGPNGYAPTESVICAIPAFSIKKAGSNGSTNVSYSNSILLEVIEHLLLESNDLKYLDTYKYDIIDITRQFGVNLANELYENLITKFNLKDLKEFEKISDAFLTLCEDLDCLLSCSKYFTLGSWLESAKKKAKDETDLKMLEWNARRQITLWSSPEITEFHDYANKQWSGLIRDYYMPRWKMFVDDCKDVLRTGGSFDRTNFQNRILSHAVEWSDKKDLYEIESNLDAIELAKEFVNKYKGMLNNI